MIGRLAWASLTDRPGRAALLLSGYALGVGVTIVLLSIGQALLDQSRDRALVGGGEVVVLPVGLDLETLKTGGVSAMYFTIDRARFAYREVLTGPRFADRVEAAAPWIEGELLYLSDGDTSFAVQADGVLPSAAAALGAAPDIVSGDWRDTPADRDWAAPGDSALYASLDALHVPSGAAVGDSTWSEWHYFNVLRPDGGGWLYLTLMIAGDVAGHRWGGRTLATLVDASAGTERAFVADFPPEQVSFRPGHPELRIADSRVRLDSAGRYRVEASIPAEGGGPPFSVQLVLDPAPGRYLPPLDLGGSAFLSGYTVPALAARVDGRWCVGVRCEPLAGALGYHDHNWGVWRDVTWDWGQASFGPYSVLYGGVARGEEEAGSRFLMLTDSLGFAGVFSIRELGIRWRDRAEPERIELTAVRGRDSVSLDVWVAHVRVTDLEGVDGGTRRRFFQMRGTGRMSTVLAGARDSATGAGFFETWTQRTGRQKGY